MAERKLSILGIRGIPAAHGGFETFAEHLAQYLVVRGWSVTVYCQEQGSGHFYESQWQGIRRVHIPVAGEGAMSTVRFDWKSVRHATRDASLVLTLGYNTAAFSLFYRFSGVTNVINMDGIEWRRDKWGALERLWLYLNEWSGARLGNALVADHPQIAEHLQRRVSADKITMIPYGAAQVTEADASLLEPFLLEPDGYALLIARPEPENSILEMVRAFSRKRRGVKLAVLGKFDRDNAYHRLVQETASDEVCFLGAIYDGALVKALRFFCRVYLHGHTVGGTNPSLVEAMGAGSPILAQDNRFNRWVAGEGQAYFRDERHCEDCLDTLLDNNNRLGQMATAVKRRHREHFTWEQVLNAYERLLISSHKRKGLPCV